MANASQITQASACLSISLPIRMPREVYELPFLSLTAITLNIIPHFLVFCLGKKKKADLFLGNVEKAEEEMTASVERGGAFTTQRPSKECQIR